MPSLSISSQASTVGLSYILKGCLPLQRHRTPLKYSIFPEPKKKMVLLLSQGALLFDSPSKSEASNVSSNISSAVTDDGSVDSSCYDENWSTQVNASCYEGVEEDEFKEEVNYYKENEEGGEGEEGYLDELCDGFEKKITIEAKLFEFKGKHTRFVYNSDEEFEGEEEIGKALPLSPSVLLLKGMPVPEGKHLRFHEDE